VAGSRTDDGRAASTAPPDVPRARVRAARWFRRFFFVLVTAIVVAGLLGFLGIRTATVQASANGYDLKVQYPKITRPGLPASVEIEVRRAGGFRGVLTVAVSSDYLSIFDVSGMDPDAVGATTTADEVRWDLQTPLDSDVMTISVDARTESSAELRTAKGSVTVINDGRPVATVSLKTRVMP
jgi:hypothetical protein